MSYAQYFKFSLSRLRWVYITRGELTHEATLLLCEVYSEIFGLDAQSCFPRADTFNPLAFPANSRQILAAILRYYHDVLDSDTSDIEVFVQYRLVHEFALPYSMLLHQLRRKVAAWFYC